MVRFSEIIKKGNTAVRPGGTPEPGNEEELRLSESQIARVMSDTQILKVRGEETSIVPPLAEDWGLDVISYYDKFIERAIDIRDRVRVGKGISPSPILSDLHHVINNDLCEKLYEYAMFATSDSDKLLIHNVDVTLVSLLVGQGMGYDIKMLLKLGLAAFLENVGMYKIPESILMKKGKLDDEETEMVKEHPRAGYEILAQMGARYKWLAEVALQVHERSDGSGYPNGLSGKQIYELASIIGLVDVYMAMIRNRPYRQKFVQTDVIKFIVQEAKSLFPSRIRKIFLNQISLFPVNTHVRLNNRSVGRVISTDKNQPLRPTLELLYDTVGNKMKNREIIRLSENPLLFITGSLHEKELP